MSSENVKKVIARAVSDAGFRELLSRSPNEAFSGYDLTEQEKSSILAGLSHEGFDALASDLGDRVSRAGVHLDDFMGEIADMVRAGEADATPIPLPDPPEPEGEIDATPITLPDPPKPGGEAEVIPITIPHPRPEDPDVEPSPIPHPGDEAEVIPITIPHPRPEDPDVEPSPIPHPGDEAEAIPITIPYPRPEGEIDATPITLPTPPPPRDEVAEIDEQDILREPVYDPDVPGATPLPIPRPEDYGATPQPIPGPDDAALPDDFGATPQPIPDPEVEVSHIPGYEVRPIEDEISVANVDEMSDGDGEITPINLPDDE